MREGDELRFRGPNGAPFAVTVSQVFTPELIRDRLYSGEWTTLDDEPMEDQAEQDGGRAEAAPASPGRPAVNAPKGEWIAHVVRLGLMAAEDAVNYTKPDLIDLADSRRT